MTPRATMTAALLLAAGAVSAQEFAGVPGLAEALAAIRASAAAQKAPPRRPGAMGLAGRSAAGRVAADSLPPSADAAPDVSAYPVRGADVSHYQGEIAWDQVATSGLSFVYMKATESDDFTDEQFARNWDGAAKAGLARGAYHFWDFCKGGSVQAARFVKTVPADPGMLPPVVDLEESGSCARLPPKASFRKSLAAFAAKVKAAYGRPPILYVNYSIYEKYFQGENDPYKLWIADVSHASPEMPGGAPWTLWQYAWHGAVAGIPGEVDLNVFNGTPEMLASLAQPTDVMVASLP